MIWTGNTSARLRGVTQVSKPPLPTPLIPRGSPQVWPRLVAYYNNIESALSSWLAFYAQPDGTVLFFDGPDDPGGNIVDLLGSAVLDVGPQAAWITEADNPDGEGPSSMRIRAILGGDVIFGAGWYMP